ncbi:MAG: hypothetical protein WKH64_04785 [Chloroflexia bacterium]
MPKDFGFVVMEVEAVGGCIVSSPSFLTNGTTGLIDRAASLLSLDGWIGCCAGWATA